MIDTRVYIDRLIIVFVIVPIFIKKKDFEDEKALREKCILFYNLVKNDSTLYQLSQNRKNITIFIEYKKKKGVEWMQTHYKYKISIQKDRAFYCNLSKKDTTFIEKPTTKI